MTVRLGDIGTEGAMRGLMFTALLLALACAILSGCTIGEGQGQPEGGSIQLQRIDVDVGGSLGPRHGPYGR